MVDNGNAETELYNAATSFGLTSSDPAFLLTSVALNEEEKSVAIVITANTANSFFEAYKSWVMTGYSYSYALSDFQADILDIMIDGESVIGLSNPTITSAELEEESSSTGGWWGSWWGSNSWYNSDALRFVISLSNFEETGWQTGKSFTEWSGNIVLSLGDDSSSAVTISESSWITQNTAERLFADFIKPEITVSSSSISEDLNTATFTFLATDKYYTPDQTIDPSKVNLLIDGETATTAAHGTTISFATPTVLNTTRNSATEQYGITQTITITGLSAHLGKGIKLRLGEGSIIDLSGNMSEQKDLSLFNTLMVAKGADGNYESSSTSGFLGNTAIQRQNIESVEFLTSTSTAPDSGTWDVSASQDGSIIAWYTGSGPYQVKIASDGPIYANEDSSYLFSYIGYASTCTATTVIIGLDNVNTSFATNMQGMFQYCGYQKMTSLSLGDNFNTSNVTNMNSMFSYCGYTAMTGLYLGNNFDTSSVTNMNSMFTYCGYTAMTTLNIGGNFDTTNVTSMNGMFQNCGYTALQSLDLGNKFYTGNVTGFTAMFAGCGYTAMTSLDLGPAFIKVEGSTSMWSSCGKSGQCTIYAPESIYSSSSAFKTSTADDATTVSYTRGTINLKYKPEWSKVTTTLDTTNKTLTIKLQGTVNSTNYGDAIKTVTNTLANGELTANSSTPINVKVDSETANNITKQVSMSYTGPAETVTVDIVLSNFEETAFQSGKSYKEWAGNVALQLATGTLVDAYGNRNIASVEIKDATETDTNTAGNMFADFVKPTVRYEHSDSTIDQSSKTATIVFTVTDKYYASENLSIDNTEIQMDGTDLRQTPVEIGWAEEDITEDGNTIGRKYTITLTELQQDIIASGKSYLDFSGVVSIIVPAQVTDKSGNTNTAKTITVGIDEPANSEHTHTSGAIIDFVAPMWTNVANGITLDFANSKATVKVKATDKYLALTESEAISRCTLTSSDIEFYLDGTKTTTGVTISISNPTLTSETRTINGTSTTVYIGAEYTITITGITLNSDQAKIVIPAGTITDQYGNTSDVNTIILYNRLKSAGTETSATSGFLGNTTIQRQNIQNVTFVSGISGSTDADTKQVWDVSAAGDSSILAWTKQTSAPYTVYIGSEGAILANRTSDNLFAYIGYGSTSVMTEAITNLNLLDTSSVTTMNFMFNYCGYNAMTSLDLGSNFNTSQVTDMGYMFAYCGYKEMENLNLGDGFDTSGVTSMTYMFHCTGFNKMPNLNLGDKFDTSSVNYMQSMFSNCGFNELTSLDLGDNFDTSSVTDMTGMFQACGYNSMTTLNLGDNFNTSQVTNMRYMFNECGYKALTSLNLGSQFNTSQVEDMLEMFAYCGQTSMQTLTLGNEFDTSSVTNMVEMFAYCGQSSMTSLNLGGKFYTTNVTDMTKMFNECGSGNMTSLDLGPAFTKIGSTYTDMFTNCGKSENVVIYAGEAIYSNEHAFKLNTDSTTEISFTRGTINPKYRPEWEKISTTYDATNKTLSITIEGFVDTTNYAGYLQTVTNKFTTGTTTLVDVMIDGEISANANITKTVSSVSGLQCVIILSNFDLGDNQLQDGRPFDEWSGNIALQILKGTLEDAYGNKNLVVEDEYIEDTTTTDTNANGKLFADFIKPEIRYQHSEFTIDYATDVVTVYFRVTDKYFKQIKLADVQAFANAISVKVDEYVEVNSVITKTVEEVDDVEYAVNSMTKVVGKLYKLDIEGLDTGDGILYSGPMTLTFPEGIAEDNSGNVNNATTITIGIDEPQNSEESEEPTEGPYIPYGYTQLAGTNLNTGFVIKDSFGNEYVWIEVPKTTDVYSADTLDLDLDSLEGDELTTAYTNIENDLRTYTTVYKSGSQTVDTYSTEAATGLTETEYYNLKRKMLKSIYQNEGFYIGRYETGIDYVEGPRSASGDTTQTPVIKQNAYPYNFVTNSQAQDLASRFGSGNYTSSLMFGVQWNLVMKYLETKGVSQADLASDSSSWGNYKGSEYTITNTNAKGTTSSNSSESWTSDIGTKTAGTAMVLTTGASDAFSKQNIYDLAGNVFEWTLEYSTNTGEPCVNRGSNWYGVEEENYYAAKGFRTTATSATGSSGFRVALYKTGEDNVIVDVVNPIWRVENETETSVDLIATDKYIGEMPYTVDELKDLIQVKVGNTIVTEGVTLTGPIAVANGQKYTLTIPSVEGISEIETYAEFLEQRANTGRLYRQQTSGEVTVTIPANTIIDISGNTNAEQVFTLGSSINDTLSPETVFHRRESDTVNKTATIIFDVTDKYFSSIDLDVDDIYVFIDKVETDEVTKEITDIDTLTAEIDGETRTIGKRYTLKLSEFETLGLENGYNYKGLSGKISIEIAEGVAIDQSGNLSVGRKADGTNNSEGQPIKGSFVDFIDPSIIYRSSETVKGTDEVQIVFDITDKYYSSNNLTDADIAIMIQDGTDDSNYISLTSIPGVSVQIGKVDKYEAGPLNKTVSEVVQEGLTNQLIGQTYTVTIKNLQQAEIADGRNYLDYSGNVTIALTDGKVSDTEGNTNTGSSLTMGIDVPEGTGSKDVVDLVDPIWTLVSQDVDLENQESEIVLRGTDKYFANSTLTNDNIELWIDGVQVETNGTSGRNVTITSRTSIYETWIVSGVEEQHEVGAEYVIKVTGFEVDAGQAKVKIPSGIISDYSGNTSAGLEFILYSCLMPATREATPGASTTAFLNNPYSIQRQNIENIEFVSGLSTADKTKWWDVSAVGDYSIMAWYKDSDGDGAYEICIGGVGGIFANPDSSYLFANIGTASNCNNTETITNLNMISTNIVTNMSYMFMNCGSNAMTGLDLGTNFNTSKVDNMTGMFSGCGQNAMITFSVGSKFDTSKVTDMSDMFSGCGKNEMTTFSLGDNFNTSSVTDMSNMFKECGQVKMATFSLGNYFNTSAVTNMSGMFQDFAYSLESLTLGDNFITNSVNNMSNMFNSCGKASMKTLTLGEYFNTASVTDMSGMFQNFAVNSTEMIGLDLENQFYTTAVTNMANMFNGCGTAGMTALDLGQYFTNIPSANTGFVTNCGTSGCVIYVPEVIYSDDTHFTTTTEEYENGTLNPIYRPEWKRTSTSLDLDETDGDGKELIITLTGYAYKSQRINSNVKISYASDIEESTLDEGQLTIYIDGVNVTSEANPTVGVSSATVSQSDSTEKDEVIHTITLSSFEETTRTSGTTYKDWSGNVSIVIAKETLKDTEGNQNFEQSFGEDSETEDLNGNGTLDSYLDRNVNGKLFADFIKPEFTYSYSSSDINHTDESVTVVFDVVDKYFASTTLSSLDATQITVKIDSYDTTEVNSKITKTLEKVQDITGTVHGATETIGHKYKLTIEELDQEDETTGIGDGFLYSGYMSLAFDSGVITDKSGNTNDATTIAIGLNENDGNVNADSTHGTGTIVDVVDPIWVIESASVETGIITLKAQDKYFSTASLTLNDITVVVNGNISTEVSKQILSGPTTTTNGVKYEIQLSNITPAGGELEGFEPTNNTNADSSDDIIVDAEGKAYFRKENGGNVLLKIAAGTITDQYTNTSNEQSLPIGTMDGTAPEVYHIQKTQNASAGTETIVFNVTDRNIDTTDLVEQSEISLYMDGETPTGMTISSYSSKEIWGIPSGATEAVILGHQYTLVVSNISETTKQTTPVAKDYLEWSGTLDVKIASTAAKDINGNNLVPTTTTISDFIDYLKPVVEQVTVATPINTTNQTLTMSFKVTDKYLYNVNVSEIDMITESEITIEVDGETAPAIKKPTTVADQETHKDKIWMELSSSPITATMNKTVNGTIVEDGTYTIGHTYTLVLSNFVQSTMQAEKTFMEWSGKVTAIIASSATLDTTNNGNDATTITGEHIDFIKPIIIKASSTRGTNTETILIDVLDKYLDTSDPLADSEIAVFVDGEGATLTRAFTKTAIFVMNKSTKAISSKATTYTVPATEQVIGERYQLVLSGFEQSSRNANNYKDWSGTVSLEIAEAAVKDTSSNINDETPIKGDFVDFIQPDLKYTSQVANISTKTYTMTFDITDKYYDSGELSLSDLSITMTNGQKDDSGNGKEYNLKDLATQEKITIGFSAEPYYATPNINVTNASTSEVETITTANTHQIGHTYTLTITGLDQLVVESGNTTANYSGVITVAVDGDVVLDRGPDGTRTTPNGNVATSITSGVDIPGGTGTGTPVDVVSPVFERISSSANAINQEAEITFKGTDTYFVQNSTLSADDIQVIINGSEVTSNINKTLVGTVVYLTEDRIVGGTEQNDVQYGYQYTLKITGTGFVQNANQLKIRIPAGKLTDQYGNSNETTELMLYNCLKSTSSEDLATEGLLGVTVTNATTGLARQNIEKVIFVDSLDDVIEGNIPKVWDTTANTWDIKSGIQNVWDVSAMGDESILAWTSQSSAPYTVYIGSNDEIFANQTSSYLFANIGNGSSCTVTTNVVTDLNKLNTNSVLNMSYMFNNFGYSKMTALDLGVFDTTNVTNMEGMFAGCGNTAMKSLDLGTTFATNNVTNMQDMFKGCGQNTTETFTFTIGTSTNIVDFTITTDTSKTVDMSGMFQNFGHRIATLTLGTNFDTSRVTDMSNMFNGCGYTAMKKLDLGDKFNTSIVQNMSGMFQNCGYTVMGSLDLGDLFYTTSATNMSNMFNGCGKTAMKVLDLGPAFTKIGSTYTDMFTNCGSSSLKIYAPESIYKNNATFKINKAGQ